MGAPSFAYFAKGGIKIQRRAECHPEQRRRTPAMNRPPVMQLGRGTALSLIAIILGLDEDDCP
jgi:hypothetical protein